MLRVYDMDGVLVDTREANRQAYLACGVTPPDDHHVRPWQEWCSESKHLEKALHFPTALREHGRELPLLDRALDWPGAIVLTNASMASLMACREAFPRLRMLPTLWEMRPDDKIAWMGQSRFGTYWDDSERMIERCRRELPGWSSILVPQS